MYDKLDMHAFMMVWHTELMIACTQVLKKQLPQSDANLTAESKGIPLAYELARQLNVPYVVARKSIKLYMTNPVSVKVKSITTEKLQTLYLSQEDADKLKGKKVIIADDVISTGESILSLEKVSEDAHTPIIAKSAGLAEGTAAERTDITYHDKLLLVD